MNRPTATSPMPWRIAAWTCLIVGVVFVPALIVVAIREPLHPTKVVDFEQTGIVAGAAVLLADWAGMMFVLFAVLLTGAIAMIRLAKGRPAGRWLVLYIACGVVVGGAMIAAGAYLMQQGAVNTGHAVVEYTTDAVVKPIVLGIAVFLPLIVGLVGSLLFGCRQSRATCRKSG